MIHYSKTGIVAAIKLKNNKIKTLLHKNYKNSSKLIKYKAIFKIIIKIHPGLKGLAVKCDGEGRLGLVIIFAYFTRINLCIHY